MRVAGNHADQICFALDAGARGIVVPMINTRAEAEAVVRACRYYPLGSRSNAGVRGEWGEFKNYRDYLDTVNDELVIVPMIETNQSLEREARRGNAHRPRLAGAASARGRVRSGFHSSGRNAHRSWQATATRVA